MTDLPEDGMLEPSSVRIERSAAGTMTVHVGDDRYEDVQVRRAFPLEMADAFIGLTTTDGDELGMIEAVDTLESSSREALEAELARIYFLPIITGFSDLGEEYGVVHADVETTSGPRHIEIRGIRANIRILSRHRALIEDTSGNRYELQDYHLLPKLTREILAL